MKIKTLVASVVLGVASMSAMASPNGLFGIGPFGVQPGHGAKPPFERPAKPYGADGDAAKGRVAEAADQAGDKAAAERRAQWAEHDMSRRIERVLRSVDGTPEQSQKITAVVKAAHEELRPMYEELRKLDQRATELFKADAIDSAAFENLRTERLQLMDRISQRSSGAYVQIANLLTPAQRQTLADRPMHPRHGKDMRGERGERRGKARGDRDGKPQRGDRDGAARRGEASNS
ncbi:MAG: Spy/CpxP family protein refolding chaperone [Lautropia sp.]|nr:Spy/CpxP family protein refolding chaperone [Lautropia sp.]